MQGWGIFDGSHDASLVEAFQAWKSNAVRVPLNEDCWLGINGVNPDFSGENYISNISAYVNMFTDAGFVVLLDLHWTAPGGQLATGQQPMPNMDHSVDLWKSVASHFNNNSNVVFELFNEPYPDGGNWNSQAGWQCFRDGGSCPGLSYQASCMAMFTHANTCICDGLIGVYMHVVLLCMFSCHMLRHAHSRVPDVSIMF